MPGTDKAEAVHLALPGWPLRTLCRVRHWVPARFVFLPGTATCPKCLAVAAANKRKRKKRKHNH